MMWLLNLLPGVGKVADAFSSYFNKKLDTDLEKYKVDGKIDETKVQALLDYFRSMGAFLRAVYATFQALFIIPLGLWWALALVNSGLRDLMGWTWKVHSFPLLENWGAGILAFLFLASIGRRA